METEKTALVKYMPAKYLIGQTVQVLLLGQYRPAEIHHVARSQNYSWENKPEQWRYNVRILGLNAADEDRLGTMRFNEDEILALDEEVIDEQPLERDMKDIMREQQEL